MKTINRKIPGILPPPPKTEVDGKIADLSSKTIPKLIELRDRQMKLIRNNAFISKLADKGEKIKCFHEKIEKELKAKQEEEQTCQLLNRLKLNSVDEHSVQNVEWEGKVSKPKVVLDSDDDSEPEDVLHILSQNTVQQKLVRVLPPERPLISPLDLERIGEIPHVKYIVDKTENHSSPKATGHFKPYHTTKSDVHHPEKEMVRKKGKHWEVTAATPPLSIHGAAKILNLEESLKLQQEYNKHLQEVEAQHAAEKLLARTGIRMAELSEGGRQFGSYREVESEAETDHEGSDKEVHDEEPDRGGVVFTVLK
ncbi:hypothetical protein JYU34_007619 [Plutella xylostella]|uniref:Protein GRINL1A n=1 Tax=Plutella xylostella TaxID=51655 RepID=A0ABQ7QR17_PLUXY|nr:hypothetical protein JYU34_007619 [Plutella xylostella]